MQLILAARLTREPSENSINRVFTGTYNAITALFDICRVIETDPLIDIGPEFEFLNC